MLGISSLPPWSRVPGGKGRPLPRLQATPARSGPSSLHWKTTSLPSVMFCRLQHRSL